MEAFKYLITVIVSYLLGSISSSVMLSKFMGGDIRKSGSGNAGATNMARIYGVLAGVATLAFDIIKAVAAMLLGSVLLGDMGVAFSGMACLLGHCFTAFHHFKGGKGVSVGAAIAFFIDWRVGITVVAVFLIVALLTKKVSLGSCAGALSISFAAFGFGAPMPCSIMVTIAMLIVIYKHKDNLKRVVAGTEPDFRFAKINLLAEKLKLTRRK